jgi:tetratricopeptide (TPR) repeat protein
MVSAQTISEEAQRHFARGMAAVEMAKSAEDYTKAIQEFEKAARLAPQWPDVFFNLGMVQEKVERYRDAIESLSQYLRLAPNAPDAPKIKEHIYKLEYKTEQVLKVQEIIDVLVSIRGWYTKNLKGCDTSRKQFDITRQGDDAVEVPSYVALHGGPNGEIVVAGSLVMEVTRPFLKYVTLFNNCVDSVYDNNHGKWPDYCFYKMENEIKVVSKTLVKVSKKEISRGSGVTTCTFEKK